MLRHCMRRFSRLQSDTKLHDALFTAFFTQFSKTPNMASVLRFAWHDAGTWDAATKTGGPNGSLRFDKELAHAANTGLAPVRDQLVTLKAQFPNVNYADFIQAAGYAAVAYAKGPTMPCLFGRTEAQSDAACPPEGRLPDASKGAAHLRDTFSRMTFEDWEIVALSGGHTLGRANKHKPGDYEGFWTHTPSTFNSDYFLNLLVKDPKLLRLPTDKALVTDLKFREWVNLYARDEPAFFEDYAKAHRKLSALGYDFDSK